MTPVISGASRLLHARLLCIAVLLTSGCENSPGPIEPATGTIRIVILTTGSSSNFDPDGYTLSIDDGPTQVVAVNTSVLGLTIPNLAPGRHTVRLDGVAANCTLSGTNPRPVDVVAASLSLTVSFDVSCIARTGNIQVTTVTSGPDQDADGYVLVVANATRGTVPANGTRTISAIPVGQFQVMLVGIAPNCAVVGTNSRLVDITFGGTADAAFTLQCVTGSALRVTTATTGVDPDLSGYVLQIRRDGADPTHVMLSANQTLTLPGLFPGEYVLTLFNMTANCDLGGSNPRSVTLPAGTEIPIALNITCSAPARLSFVNGFASRGEIQVVNSNGSDPSRLTTQPGADLDPAWSPDGSRIAFASDRDGNREIYVMNADGSGLRRLTNVPGADHSPSWSPDGSRIMFVSERDGNAEIYVMSADGANPVRVTTHVGSDVDPAWSPDGTRIAFASSRDGLFALYLMNTDGSGITRLDLVGSREDMEPAWSPDGTRIAFSRRISAGDRGIFIANADGSGLAGLANAYGNGTGPAWYPDGRKIAFAVRYQDYYYYDLSNIVVLSLEGVPFTLPTNLLEAFSPAWRPG